MSRKLRIAYLAHSLRSDWNNGNAHFLRGLLRAMTVLGHDVLAFEREHDWSIENLRQESAGEQSLGGFRAAYPELRVELYRASGADQGAYWRAALRAFDVVILHEWNPPELAQLMLQAREELGFRLLFHDTHHRASSSPEQMRSFRTNLFDGVIAFGAALAGIYRHRFGIRRAWVLHEAADTTVFRPLAREKTQDAVWIGNWGDEERSGEIREFLLKPAKALPRLRFTIFGVRYPESAQRELNDAGAKYGGYLANLRAPEVYSESRLTMHVPRQQYVGAMGGIPTIRVFEALACGIPLISAPWKDTEQLFRPGDFLCAANAAEMQEHIERLLLYPQEAKEQAQRGLETILARHTCMHRAQELTSICEEALG